MKVVVTQAVCPEGMRLLDGLAEVYVADYPDPNNYLSADAGRGRVDCPHCKV